MPDTRTSLWLRWPDPERGPLWLGIHLNERGGESVAVGLEIWTEEPGRARRSLGPEADGADDLLPWPPVPLRGDDVRSLSLTAVGRAVRTTLAASADDPAIAGVLAALETPQVGRPALYPPEHYDRVAGVYLRAVTAGSKSPTADVAAQWGVSRSAAAKWVMRARREGKLNPDR